MPIIYEYTCNECGNGWQEKIMVREKRYCPKCGSNDLKIVEEKKND